jgi:hypothetical protein
LSIKNPSENKYLAWFSGGDNKEHLVLNLDYDRSQKSVSGNAQIQTDSFNVYKDYYLGRDFNGWQVDVGQGAGECSFAYKNGDLGLNGKVKIDDVKGKYGDNVFTGGGEIAFKLGYIKGMQKPGATAVSVKGKDLAIF